jgi:phytoene dehydrogenase-like protein
MTAFASRYDAIVIGASVNGLAAAALLADAGAQVLLVERSVMPPEPEGPLYALDPLVVDRLKLARRGLRFKARDLPLAGLAEGAAPLILGRNVHSAARALAALGEADAKAWIPFRRDLFAEGRRLRRWWWHAHGGGQPADMLGTRKARTNFERLAYSGADAFLRSRFESEALRALLLFDAVAGGFSPSEPGSTLALVWRCAQEMAGLQGAVALPACGTLVAALARAARGVHLRLASPVAAILERDGQAGGVTLADGSQIEGRMVLCAISTPATQRLLGDTPQHTARVGEAQLIFRLSQSPDLPMPFNFGRAVIADTTGGFVDAHEAARGGRLPDSLPLECVATDHQLIVTVRPVPITPREGWEALKPLLAARIVRTLAPHAPGFARHITGVTFRLPRMQPKPSLAQLLAPPAARLKTRLPNLLVCGRDAEPVPSISGRAGRMAAVLASQVLSGKS